MLDYLDEAYLPAAQALRQRVADGGAAAKAMAAWDRDLRRAWPGVHIGEPDFVRRNDGWDVSVPIYLGAIPRRMSGWRLRRSNRRCRRRGRGRCAVARRTASRGGERLSVSRTDRRHPPGRGLYGPGRTVASRGVGAGGNHADPLAEVTVARWPRLHRGGSRTRL